MQSREQIRCEDDKIWEPISAKGKMLVAQV